MSSGTSIHRRDHEHGPDCLKSRIFGNFLARPGPGEAEFTEDTLFAEVQLQLVVTGTLHERGRQAMENQVFDFHETLADMDVTGFYA
jgi:hypothetical protein